MDEWMNGWVDGGGGGNKTQTQVESWLGLGLLN